MNKKLYKDENNNSIRLSEFRKYNGQTTFNNIAAKFVVDGTETYHLKDRKFVVEKGEYIIGNNDQLSEVIITERTVGLCVDISKEIISEILSTFFDNHDLEEFILTDKFLINKYNANNTTLGLTLADLSKELLESGEKESILRSDLFYTIGENIVIDQAFVFEQYSRLNFKKQLVNEEVYMSLRDIKNYIDDCYLEDLNIDVLVRICCISKFAFIRLFKITFGVSPYQYILQKRLHHAKALLLKNNSVQDVAFIVCFADTPSFSKAFKSYFGINPSELLK